MKKLILISLAFTGLFISSAFANQGPGRFIHILVVKKITKPVQLAALELKTKSLIPGYYSNPDVNIYTSPASDYINISTNAQEDLTMRIYDMNDNEIAQSEIRGGQAKLSTEELPAGTYTARTSLKSGGIVNVQKINLLK